MVDLQKEKTKEVQNLFNKNNLHYDFNVYPTGVIVITVENGDWKHDHLRFKKIMYDAGFTFIGRHVKDEESGDDSFTAFYLYV